MEPDWKKLEEILNQSIEDTYKNTLKFDDYKSKFEVFSIISIFKDLLPDYVKETYINYAEILLNANVIITSRVEEEERQNIIGKLMNIIYTLKDGRK